MIKIYKYSITSKEYLDVIQDRSLSGKKRDEAIDAKIKEIGKEVSVREYFSDYSRDSWRIDYRYAIFGEPENCIEKLAKSETNFDNDLSYLSTRNNCPEDLIEERTSWDEMKDFASGLANFIESLESEIATGKIVVRRKGLVDAEKLKENLYHRLEKYPKDYQILTTLDIIDKLEENES